MFDAVGETGIHGFTAEMEVRLAGMAHRPAADLVRQVEQAGLVGDLGAGLGRHQAARRRGRDWCLLVAGALAQKPPGPTETILGRSEFLFGIGCEGDASWRDAGGVVGCAGAAGAAGLGAAGLGAAFFAAGLGAGFGLAGAAFFFSFALTGEGRDLRPRRCALPITALRLTPPSSSAIWLAVEPPSHIFLSVAIRSSVQLIAQSCISCLDAAACMP